MQLQILSTLMAALIDYHNFRVIMSIDDISKLKYDRKIQLIFIGDKNHRHYQRYCGLFSAFTRKENTWNTWNLPIGFLGTYRSKLKKPWWRRLPMDRTVTQSPFDFLLMNVLLCNYSYDFFAFPSGFKSGVNSFWLPCLFFLYISNPILR